MNRANHISNLRLQQSLNDFVIGYNSDCVYWGEFALFINFIEQNYGTCAVNFKNASMNFYYNNKWLDTLDNQLQVNFVVVHELQHLLSDHMNRSKRANFKYKLANIAMDMVINSNIIDTIPKTICEMPKNLFKIPAEYEGERIFEILYYWLANKKEQYDEMVKDMEKTQSDKQPGDDQQDSDEKDDEKKQGNGTTQEDIDNAFSKELQTVFKNAEDYVFDEHMLDDVPDELKDEIRKDIINNLKQRGFQTSNIEKLLQGLTKAKKDYLREIKSGIAMLNSNKKAPTITKLNRRNIAGLKGKKKEGFVVNAILDTSGSMDGLFENVLSYVFQDNIVLNMIQCDTEVKSHAIIKTKSQLNGMTIKGLGGTALQPAIDYIANCKLNKVNTVILTDGMTDKLDFTKISGKVLIIAKGQACEIVNNGKVKQIVVTE